MLHTDALCPAVLEILGKATGISSADAWRSIFLLISKSEHDNEKIKRAFLTDKGQSVFFYASALKYDQAQRGVTLGLVGWTTGNDHKDGDGDAPALFKVYKSLGGEDLMPYVDGCCKSKDKCEALISKIKDISADPVKAPKFIEAQWRQLVSDSPDGAYIHHCMKAFKKIKIKPSALALAVVLDTSLNCGHGGPDGGCSNLIKVATPGNEEATLKKYIEFKIKVSRKNEYNDPPSNGTRRGEMFQSLFDAKCFSLVDCDRQLKKATSWKMK